MPLSIPTVACVLIVVVCSVSESSAADVCLGERCSIFSTRRCAAGTSCRGTLWDVFCVPGDSHRIPSPKFDLPYNRNAFLVTHNAYSTLSIWYFLAANQIHTIQRQLAEGVRGFMLDLHYHRGEIYLCHSRCDIFTRLGKSPEKLSSAFAVFKSFLDLNPHEVLTFFLESYVGPVDALEVFKSSGLLGYVYAKGLWPEPGSEWPPLKDMAPAVVLFDTGDWDVLKESMYGTMNPYKCDQRAESIAQDGKTRNLVLVNNFAPFMGTFNVYASLRRKLRKCREELGQWANFLAVDYYHSNDRIGGSALAVRYLQSKWQETISGQQCGAR